jgi:DNA-directed RNA polymerase subunit alpha
MVEKKLVSEFKRPSGVEYKQEVEEKDLGVFVAKPYERGFGITVGNSLRRTLLSAMPGSAIIAVKFDKINNEFQNLKGVLQDTTEIIANLKTVAISLKDPNVKNRVLHFEIKGKRVFKASDLKIDETIDIGNPDHIIFSANKEADFEMTLQVESGRGYVPSEQLKDSVEAQGVILLDANYSPIRNVAFEISPIRIGNRNDYEKLSLSIHTNGLISPEEALREAAQILKESYFTFNNIETEVITQAVDDRRESVSTDKDRVFYQSVYLLELTVRSYYFLKLNEIRQIGQLVTKTEEEIKDKKKFSAPVLEDIKEKLALRNLTLGMKNIDYVAKNMV